MVGTKYVFNLVTSYSVMKRDSGVPFKTFNVVYSVDDSNEKLDIFNSFFKSCLDKHAPLRRIWLNEQGRHQEASKRTECTY